MQVKRIGSTNLAAEKLPDGSTAIFDPASKTVYSLNATAAAAWEACGESSTLAQVVEAMQRSFNPAVTEETALEALSQLQEKGLVSIAEPHSVPTRRSAMAAAAALAAPLVLALTFAEQKAHAVVAASGRQNTN
jgi:hypothetical protein